MKIPTPIAAAAASAQARRSEGITDAGYLDRLAETGGHDWPAGRDGKGARRAHGDLGGGATGARPRGLMYCVGHARETVGPLNPGNKAQSDRADARAAELAPILTKLRASGIASPRALAAALTARNIPTRSGRGSWTARTVRSLVARIKRLEP